MKCPIERRTREYYFGQQAPGATQTRENARPSFIQASLMAVQQKVVMAQQYPLITKTLSANPDSSTSRIGIKKYILIRKCAPLQGK